MSKDCPCLRVSRSHIASTTISPDFLPLRLDSPMHFLYMLPLLKPHHHLPAVETLIQPKIGQHRLGGVFGCRCGLFDFGAIGSGGLAAGDSLESDFVCTNGVGALTGAGSTPSSLSHDSRTSHRVRNSPYIRSF